MADAWCQPDAFLQRLTLEQESKRKSKDKSTGADIEKGSQRLCLEWGSAEAKKTTKQYYSVTPEALGWVGQVIGATRESTGDDVLGTDLINSFKADHLVVLQAEVDAFDSASLPGTPEPAGRRPLSNVRKAAKRKAEEAGMPAEAGDGKGGGKGAGAAAPVDFLSQQEMQEAVHRIQPGYGNADQLPSMEEWVTILMQSDNAVVKTKLVSLIDQHANWFFGPKLEKVFAAVVEVRNRQL